MRTTHTLIKSYWKADDDLRNAFDQKVHFDFHDHCMEYQDMGSVHYRLLPRSATDYGQVRLELSYDNDHAPTGRLIDLSYFLDRHLFAPMQENLRPLPIEPQRYEGVRKLHRYRWEDDNTLIDQDDDRRITTTEEDFLEDTFRFEDLPITYRLLPKTSSTTDVFVSVSWDDQPCLSIQDMYFIDSILNTDIF